MFGIKPAAEEPLRSVTSSKGLHWSRHGFRGTQR
jgi:hypothetical protein